MLRKKTTLFLFTFSTLVIFTFSLQTSGYKKKRNKEPWRLSTKEKQQVKTKKSPIYFFFTKKNCHKISNITNKNPIIDGKKQKHLPKWLRQKNFLPGCTQSKKK